MDRRMYNKMVRLIKHNMNIACDIHEGKRKDEQAILTKGKSLGWANALMWVIDAIENGSPVSDAPTTERLKEQISILEDNVVRLKDMSIDEEISAEIQMLKGDE